MSKRDELVKFLNDFADGNGKLSERSAHREAEQLLLELLGDDELAMAWDAAAEQWWYS